MPVNKDYLERKVDEINKQIAAQRMEIAGLLNVEPSVSFFLTSIVKLNNLLIILCIFRSTESEQTLIFIKCVSQHINTTQSY